MAVITESHQVTSPVVNVLKLQCNFTQSKAVGPTDGAWRDERALRRSSVVCGRMGDTVSSLNPGHFFLRCVCEALVWVGGGDITRYQH